MNNYTLESFINFCDDMMIAEEGFNVKDIKTTIIKLFERLLDKVTEFILKCTKNKSVKVDTDFAMEFRTIERDLNDLGDKINTEYDNCDFLHTDYAFKALKRLNDRITELNKISITENETTGKNFSLMNTYKIFKEMNTMKENIRKRISYMKTKDNRDDYYDEYEFAEREYDKFYLKICECKFRLYQTVYSKIKDLK